MVGWSPLFLEEGGLILRDAIATGFRGGLGVGDAAVTIFWRFYVWDSEFAPR